MYSVGIFLCYTDAASHFMLHNLQFISICSRFYAAVVSHTVTTTLRAAL